MVYRFERFLFDPDGPGLLDGGRPVRLEPQVFSLLKYLIENRGRIVSKDELIAEIWGGRAITDAALNTRIRAVRRALGDDRRQQRFLRTYPKRGFQFVSRTDCLEPGEEDAAFGDTTARDSAGTPAQRTAPRPGVTPWPRVAILAVILLAAAGAWLLEHRPTLESGRPAAGKLSIAVLPFDNLSGDPGQDYFADAFTEDLITDLSRIRDAFVIARRSSFTYKGKAVDVTEVAAELGVRYVLEGSVRRAGEAVRINAQLIDGRNGSHVWSDRYDRVVTDAFSVQSDVTGRIAAVLKAELREADSRRQGPPASLEAWDYALRGNVLLFNPRGAEDFREAKALLETALQRDPAIASAWSGLAFVHFVASLRPIPGISSPDSKDLSLAAAQKAVSFDPKNAEGHWMIGVGYARNGRPGLAMAHCDTAMALNPNNDCAYVCAGLTSMALGKPDEALPHFRHSLRLNPRFRPFTKYKYMGLAYIQSGADGEAVAVLHRAIGGAPQDPVANLALTSALALSGRDAEAKSALETALPLAQGGPATIERLRASHSWLGPGFERVLDGLRLAGLPEG